MASSYLNDYCGEENLTVSRYGVARMKWNPRMISAKRDFPKAFFEVSDIPSPAPTDEPQNISDGGYGVYQSPKRQKVYVDHEEGSTDTGTSDLAYESSDDSVFCETDDSVSSGSYTCTGMDSSDYDMIPETIIEDEDTDCHELISTDKVRPYVKRSVSAVRCFPPGCGRNVVPLSDEQLEKELRESKNHWLTCESCRINDDDDEESCADNEDLISVTNLQDCVFDSEPFGKKSGTNENAISRMNNEHTENCEKIRSRRPRVRAVRYLPPGCVVPLTEEELKLATTVLRKHM